MSALVTVGSWKLVVTSSSLVEVGLEGGDCSDLRSSVRRRLSLGRCPLLLVVVSRSKI